MAEAYLAVLGASGALTVLLVAALWWGLGRHSRVCASGRRPTVAVVVAARNEARNIDACLAHLARQDYPGELTQVAVVDDASEDDTAARATSWRPSSCPSPSPGSCAEREQSLKHWS